MSLVAILYIIIAILSIALIIAIVCLILQHNALKVAKWNLSLYNRLHR